MKKIFSLSLSLVAALMLAMWSSQASALNLGQYDKGQIVPVVTHNGADVDTLVGITMADGTIVHNATTSPMYVYWTFFDVNSNHITDGHFPMTTNDYYAFDWKKESGNGLANAVGYLVFTVSANDGVDLLTSTASIAANAFLVDSTAKDAIFVPVIPLWDNNYASGVVLSAMNANSIISLHDDAEAPEPTSTVDIRYWIDPAYQATTVVTLWSVCSVAGGQLSNGTYPGMAYTAYAYDVDENYKSVNFVLKNAELNQFDPATLAGMPANFLDGFIRWTIPVGSCNTGEANDMVVFSHVDSNMIGAAQTMLAGQTSF